MKNWSKIFTLVTLAILMSFGFIGCTETEEDDPVVTTITVEPGTATLTVGTTQQFSATVLDDQGVEMTEETVVWSSNDAAIATIDADGLATGIDAGIATISATLGTISGTAALTIESAYPADALVSMPVTTAPVEDASIDALWADVDGLDINTVVAEYYADSDGHDIWWDEYEGMEIDVNMKSVYTDDDIYFLYTWNDEADSKTRQAWFYNAGTDTWQQMGKKVPDAFGNAPAYEDKFTVFWNISIDNFENTGCATLCHGAYMRSNSAGELADIWHWKRDRTAPVYQVDDKWLDSTDPNGRHSDDGTGAYTGNVQTLITSANDTISAPAYWIPGRTDYHWIMQTEIDNGTAKQIVDLNSDNNYIDEDGTILVKTNYGYDSAYVIPSLMGIQPGTDSRGNVSAWHNWENGLWSLKIKRARATDTVDQDVQFTDVGVPYWFSIGVMNGAAIAHATPGGMAGTASALYLSE